MRFANSDPLIGYTMRDTLAGMQDARTRQLADLSRAAIGGIGAEEEGRLMARGAAPASSSSGTDFGSLLTSLGSAVRGFTSPRTSTSDLFPYGDYTNAFRGL